MYVDKNTLFQSTKDSVLFNDTFSIDSVSGNIILKKPLDYEEIQFFQFRIFAVVS